MDILGLIPARCGSKSIPKKNIVPLGGHPLMAWSIAASRMSRHVTGTIVSTDCDEFAAVAEAYGARAPFLRPAAISQDQSLDIELVRHCLDWLQGAGEPLPELILHLRPTTPLRHLDVVDAALDWMIAHPEADSLRSASRTSLTPYKMFTEKDGYAAPFLTLPGAPESYNLPRQAFPETFQPNGYVDVLRPRVLLETGLLHGRRMKLWQTPPVPDIDDLADYDFALRVLDAPEFAPLRQYMRAFE